MDEILTLDVEQIFKNGARGQVYRPAGRQARDR